MEYDLPWGWAGKIACMKPAACEFARLLAYRSRIISGDLAFWSRYPGPARRFAISGASGFVGSALLTFLRAAGHEVLPLVRRPANPGEISWDPEAGKMDAAALEGLDAVIHLAGESVAAGRWTARRKERIRASRVLGTRLIAATLARLRRPPRAFVSASAVGYYGSRGDEILHEESPPGSDFLAEVCKAWEDEARTAERVGIRVCRVRIPMVLSQAGGALAKMLPPFRMGLGGKLGSGQSWVSWIALDDLLDILTAAALDERLSGPVNAMAPAPCSNAELTATLARVLRRPAVFPVPTAFLKVALGEFADAVLASQRGVPSALQKLDWSFRFPALESALRHTLGSEPRD